MHALVPSRLVRRPFSAATLAIALTLPAGLSAQSFSICSQTPERAASLLYPYFAVDLDDPHGQTTMISINNADHTAQLAHVVLWTNWGHATFAFDLLLAPRAVQTINLRSFFTHGTMPITGEGLATDDFPSCPSPIAPTISAGDLEAVRDLHRGVPNPLDGHCYSDIQDPGMAVGYLTVDLLHDCSTTILTPEDEGYFGDGGTGLASNRNALWGDAYLVAEEDNFAQGLNAVSLVADADRYGPELGMTFYDRTTDGSDNRRPLNSTHRLRFLNGGGFDGGTQVVVWNAGLHPALGPLLPEGGECVEPPQPGLTRQFLFTNFLDEPGDSFDFFLVESRRRLFSLEVGGPALPVSMPFGHIELAAEEGFPLLALPFSTPIQSTTFALLDADGRLSVSVDGSPMAGFCPQD